MADGIDSRLKGIKSLSDHFHDRKARAKERLSVANGRYWNFAMLGVKTNGKLFEFGTLAIFRQVIEPPGEVELASALKNKAHFSALGRYSHSITHELAVNSEDRTDQACFDMGWRIVSALRIKSLCDILIPVAADYSWSTIAAVEDGRCDIQLIEDVPQARKLDTNVDITKEHFEWAFEHLASLMDLLEILPFRLAVDSLTTYHHTANLRMMPAALWIGIEALFGIESELRFRLATYLAPKQARFFSGRLLVNFISNYSPRDN